MKLEKHRVLPIIRAALKEDIGPGDVTTIALVDKLATSKASIVTNNDCVACGLEIAEWAMGIIDYSVRFKPNCNDGTFVGAGKELVFLDGHTGSILRTERTMLNFIAFLSGIATKTRQYVDKAKPYGVKILDTRKTLPLLRYLEKYAVVTGGGINHRMGLYDQVLIKDNHIGALRSEAEHPRRGQIKKISLMEMVEVARRKNIKGTVIEIEVSSVEEFNDAITGKPDIIMLDNMSPSEVRSCMEIRRLSKIKAILEVSGEDYAKTKVDNISIGSITSSVKSIDLSLEIV
ncbi:MAG: carboxylating nicotinate-nucleotide diphosphorylase [Candidatus Omnitrophica bacterium]|nr:carboxylating nicotinate-nucleotide diphosphorylase [Candidatus Omnitrophota bacterium]